MNRSIVLVLVCAVLLLVSVPVSSFAEERLGSGYITIKPGAYIPQGDLHDKDFDNSFAGEIAIGTYYTRNLALEAGVSYFQTKASKSDGGVSEDDKVWVIPVTITFKGVLPLKGAELMAGAGVGVYFANINAKGTSLAGSFDNDGHGTAFGGHAVVGANVDITRTVFLGAEGKYIFTTRAHLLDARVNLDGFILTGVLGYRF